VLAQRRHRPHIAAMKPFAIADDLGAILDDVWTRLVRGVADRRSAFHTPVVATASADAVRQRVMVLRGADRASATLRFHTDARSPKVAAIGAGLRASVLGYDPGLRIQISLGGTLSRADDETVEAAWAKTALSSRRGYLVTPGPGTPVEQPQSGLPEPLLLRAPTAAESEPGRERFTVLLFTIEQIDWLELTREGNRRACFTLPRSGEPAGTWVIP
jgi:pyridoxamine 5'-phosphate oxidase